MKEIVGCEAAVRNGVRTSLGPLTPEVALYALESTMELGLTLDALVCGKRLAQRKKYPALPSVVLLQAVASGMVSDASRFFDAMWDTAWDGATAGHFVRG